MVRGKTLKILIELLGGTIGSHKDETGTVVLGRDMTDILPEGIDTVIRSPLTYSSENATAEVYRDALKAISQDMDETAPDGVLILHGTDTMAYFVLTFLAFTIRYRHSRSDCRQCSSSGRSGVRLQETDQRRREIS